MDFKLEININVEKGPVQSSEEGAYDDEIDEYCTPKQFRHKRLDLLTNPEMRSPLLKIPASPVMQRLGYGTGVGVYLMERSPRAGFGPRSPWAIKKISKARPDTDLYKARLEYEANILQKLSHPNIIGYRAFGNPSVDTTYLAMEKASLSLGDLIEQRVEDLTPTGTTSPFPASQIEKVAVDVAKALNYLHEDKKLVHGDLKSPNVLIFGDFEIAKLCDFGVSRKIKDDGVVDGRYVGTELWNSLEVIMANRGKKTYAITAKADIYSFGLTLNEMMSLKPPHLSTAEEEYGGTTTDTDKNDSNSDFDERAFDDALSKQLGKRPSLPNVDFDASYDTILGVFYCCTEEIPDERPTAAEILKILNTSSDLKANDS